MNLLIDFGNTRHKASVFNDGVPVDKIVFLNNNELLSWLKQFNNIHHCLIASVTKNHEETLDLIKARYKTLVFTADTAVPLKNAYQSAATLGSDRLAVAVGAYTICPNQNVLSIDAGTCIKYNFTNKDNCYLGGAISPGIAMRLKAMHHYTAALPSIEPNPKFNALIGTNTNESLQNGALLAAACEIDGMIGRYLYEFPDLHVYITGGDADYLCKQLKNRFFANPDLLMIGLNTILKFNDK